VFLHGVSVWYCDSHKETFVGSKRIFVGCLVNSVIQVVGENVFFLVG